jgi:hypothetical protein
MSWDSQHLYGYLDGISKGSTSYTYGACDTSSQPFYIGRNELNRVTNGNIYNTLVYNKTLSSYEVLQNYQAMRKRFGL